MDDKYVSSLGIITPPDRAKAFKNPDAWLDNKRDIDGAEGLWRVYDNLYDLTDFVSRHPGGKFWLEATKGTDITEGFESHHISTTPQEILHKHFIRKAKTPRNSPFTFEENGFYKTVKRNVREALKKAPKNSDGATKIITDALLLGAFTFPVLACIFWNTVLAVISGFFLTCTAIAAHNYGHQKDNFRMYYSDLALLPTRDVRIIHILSHHLFTNTVADMQAYNSEPMINFFPHSKSKWVKYGSWIYIPTILWPSSFYFILFGKLYQCMSVGFMKSVCKTDILFFILPSIMYFFGGQSLLSTIGMWLYIIAVHGFFFGFIGTTTSHFHPDIFIDGDKPRPLSERDWGINQLDTVSDRHEVTGNLFLVLVTFGDHALHHLFPTLDHGVLNYLYPVVEKTTKEFNVNIRMTSQADMFGGYFRQLARDKPNPNPPNLFKNK